MNGGYRVSLYSHESGLEIISGISSVIQIGSFLRGVYSYFTKVHLSNNKGARFSIEIRKIDSSGNIEEKKILIKDGDKPLTKGELEVIKKAIE